MSNSTASLPSDFSRVIDAVEAMTEHVDTLHSALDGFAEGRTSQLSGQRVREAVRYALAGLDSSAQRLRALGDAGLQQTRGYVTATLLATLAAANDDFQALNRVLYPIYFDRGGHNISATQHSRLTASLLRLQDNLSRMNRSLGRDPHALHDPEHRDDDRPSSTGHRPTKRRRAATAAKPSPANVVTA